jgi:hypothetical protein
MRVAMLSGTGSPGSGASSTRDCAAFHSRKSGTMVV